MPKILRDGQKAEYVVERLDGGLNTKDSPSKIDPFESPDCLNVVYADQGSVTTRDGTKIFNTQAVASAGIDGGASYNGSMIVACNGDLFRASGTTFVTIASAQGVFTAGNKMNFVQHQGVLFMSDGAVNYKYADDDRFHQMGIAVPSSVTGSGTSAGIVAADTYYYKVAYVNTQVVAGEPGSISVGVTIGSSLTVGITSIPVGVASLGVDQRWIYRATATAGTFKRVGTIADNSTTTLADNTGVGSEGVEAEDDGTAPTPWTTAILHKDRIFFDDSTDRNLLRYTQHTVPFISDALNFKPLNTKGRYNITAIDVQDDFLTVFMDDNETWIFDIVDPTDDTSFVTAISPDNLGIAGPWAKTRISNGLFFVGKQNGKITGFHILSGIRVIETADEKLRTRSIAEKIEPNILAISSADWANINCMTFGNRIFTGFKFSTDTNQERFFWFDIDRLGSKGQPGSYTPWNGINNAFTFEHDGKLYCGSGVAEGFVLQMELADTYNDRGAAIDSYFRTREDGGGPPLQHFHKDMRHQNIYFERLGAWEMSVRHRVDGDKGEGNLQNIDLTPGGSLWGTAEWGVSEWGGGKTDDEIRLSLGTLAGKRLQTRFDNQNTADQAFKVHSYSNEMNIRSRR